MGLLGDMVTDCLFKTLPIVFRNDYTIFHFFQKCMRVLVALDVFQTSFFLVILVGVRGYWLPYDFNVYFPSHRDANFCYSRKLTELNIELGDILKFST